MILRRLLASRRGGPFGGRPGPLPAVLFAGWLVLVAALAAAPGSCRAAPICAGGPLADSLEAAAGDLDGQAQIGVLAVSLDRGDTLLASGEARRLIPGSNTKIFTTSAFLERFGPEARLTTRIEARGKTARRKDGTVRLTGELVLRASGAPDVTQLLSPGSRGLLDSLAVLLHHGGLGSFHGTLWVDGTLFAPQPYGPGWAIEDAVAAYGAMVGAVMSNGNATMLVATADHRGVSLAFDPPETPLTIEGSVGLGLPGSTPWVDLMRDPGSTRLRVQGRVPPGETVKKWIAAPDPDSTAGLVLLGALRRAGVEVDAKVRLVPHPPGSEWSGGGSDPPAAPFPPVGADSATGFGAVTPTHPATVLALVSPTAQEIVSVVNALSLNTEAEALLRLLDPAPREKRREIGVEEVRRIAAEAAGIDTLDLSLVDGSGLSPMDLVTPRAIVAWLATLARDSTLSDPFRNGLATPGTPGTLRNRFADLDRSADLHGKTGTLTNVSALSGYLRTADGERVAFSILTNGNRGSVADAHRMEERIVTALSRFRRPYGPMPEPAEPPPPEAR
ncbi:MAG: D-alanyl-D-alanine carboxypeptidase/D-alanyl-D-alanine-endopeptidase [Hyphomicrobiales bacterium]